MLPSEAAQMRATPPSYPLEQGRLPVGPGTLHLRREDCADTYARAELLVGIFQSRRNVYGIAIGRVVEEATATEIADDRRACMNTDPCNSQRDVFFAPTLAKLLGVFIQRQGAIDRAGGMVRLLTGGPEQHMQSVTNDLCDRTIVRKYDVSHASKIIVEQRPKDIGFDRLDKRGKTSNVAEQRCDLSTLSPEIHRGPHRWRAVSARLGEK